MLVGQHWKLEGSMSSKLPQNQTFVTCNLSYTSDSSNICGLMTTLCHHLAYSKMIVTSLDPQKCFICSLITNVIRSLYKSITWPTHINYASDSSLMLKQTQRKQNIPIFMLYFWKQKNIHTPDSKTHSFVCRAESALTREESSSMWNANAQFQPTNQPIIQGRVRDGKLHLSIFYNL